MKSSYLVYYNSDLMNYINSFIICNSCNQEYEPSEVVKDECKQCIIKAWEAFGYY